MATSKIQFNPGINTYTNLSATDDLDNLPRNICRTYYLGEGENRPIHCPPDANYAHLVTWFSYQIVFDITTRGDIYVRRYVSGAWQSWFKFDGIVIQ